MSKKQKEEFDLENYSSNEDHTEIVYKPDVDVVLQKELSEAIGMPGFRMGAVTAMYGLSNSGKTSIMIHAAVQAQKQGITPIFIITENKMDWSRAERMGLDISKSRCIIREDLEYLEDVYNYISQKIEDVKTGRLPRDIMIFWDSVASTPSIESLEIDKTGKIKKKYGPQKNAAVIGYYNPIIMKRIASTRQTDCDHTVGLVMLTQAYIKPPEFPGGMATMIPNGGEKIWFPLSLCLQIKEGGELSSKVDGRKVVFGTVCRVKVAKNHLTSTSTEGEFVITSDAILPNTPEAIEAYKKANKDSWGTFSTDDGEELEDA
jgi:hypothetical protein